MSRFNGQHYRGYLKDDAEARDLVTPRRRKDREVVE